MQHYADDRVHQDDHIGTLLDGLSSSDRAFLHSVLSNMSYNEWLNWYFEQAERIDRFLYSTASERKKRLKGVAADERVLIQFGAIWNAQLACRIAPEFEKSLGLVPCYQSQA